MKAAAPTAALAGARRLDQWLWFARFTKSRSLAARLIAGGAISLNGLPVKKANQAVRIGDNLVVPQGGFRRAVRVLALGSRRGPAAEARALYEDSAAPMRLASACAEWVPLLVSGAAEDGEHCEPG